MNGRAGYITTEITQSKGRTTKKKEAQRKERGSWEVGGAGGFPSLGEASLLFGTLSRLVLYIFHPQNKPSPHQSPTFGPILYKFIVMGPVRKLGPYRINYETASFNYEMESIMKPRHSK